MATWQAEPVPQGWQPVVVVVPSVSVKSKLLSTISHRLFTGMFLYSRLAQDNDTGLTVTEVGDQLIGGGRVNGGGTTATSGGRGEPLWGAGDADRGDLRGQCGHGRENECVLHGER